MDKERVRQRIDLVSSSTGSIVSVATWCALHAAAADVVIGEILDKMRLSGTSDATRASLVYVLHEILLTCSSHGVSESGRRMVLLAIGKGLPGVLQEVLGGGQGERRCVLAALQRVLTWWAMLRLFPRQWMQSVRQLVSGAEERQSRAEDNGLPSTVQRVAELLKRYSDAKAQVRPLKRVKTELGQLDEGVNEVVLQRLSELQRTATEGRAYLGSAIIAWCEDERAALCGTEASSHAATTVAGNPADGVVTADARVGHEDAGEATTEGEGQEDDILASFY